MTNKATHISWGLFNKFEIEAKTFIPDVWRVIKNHCKDCFFLTKRVFFTLKHGYAPQATWETYYWFIDFMRDILVNYRDHRNGTPILRGSEDFDEDQNEASYNELINKMLALLDKMDECIYTDCHDLNEQYSQMEQAKNEFFELFSKHFYQFWD